MANLRRTLARSNHPAARALRSVYRKASRISLPLPRFVLKLMLWTFLVIRKVYYEFLRIFICEPLTKAYFTSCGKNFHTGSYVHWIQGKGDIFVGDDVTMDGKVDISFASRLSDRPTFRVGNRSLISHKCFFTIGKEITIGDDCLIAARCFIFDSNGHPADPALRRAGAPPSDSDCAPIHIGNNVWIGTGSVILKGVTIGDNSIVAAYAVVTKDVPPNVVVTGNPAQVRKQLTPPEERLTAEAFAASAH